MEDTLIAELEAKAPVKEPIHQPTSKNKKHPEEKKDQATKYTRAKTPEELRKMSKEEREKYFAWCRDRDREKVKGVFRFYERPGGDMQFVFRGWLGDPVEKYSMIDGQTYEIPLGVARHLNMNGWYPEYGYIPGGKTVLVPGGQPTNMRIEKKVRRFGFQKMDFLEEGLDEYGDVPSGIVAVEFVGNQNLTGQL
jgi:hypothetical protein